MKGELYPLRFEPLLRHYVWGGRRLVEEFGKPDGGQDRLAETWEICDRGDDQSVVLYGPLAGKTLAQIATEFPRQLYGRRTPPPRFPLLFKFLDAKTSLSVQVHPNDEQGARLIPPDLGKTEAWVVLHADPGSVIYAGLKRGFDEAALAREVARGTTDLCLHRFEPRAGDCVFLPAGVVHALGAGIVVAEIQQSSDTTFRLFDWNRVGADGQPRPLHVGQALATIDYSLGPIEPQRPQAVSAADGVSVEGLVQCDKFVLERWGVDRSCVIGGDDDLRIVAVLSGRGTLEGDSSDRPLGPGDCALVPAEAGGVRFTAIEPVTMLVVRL